MQRRRFLKTAAAAPFAGATFFNMMNGFHANAANTTGYKAIVCVFLFGGMDCHDTILPFDQPSYDRYAEIRASLLDAYETLPGGSTRARNALLPLSPLNGADFGSRQFALPPEMQSLHTLFEGGDAAIIGNVGPLLEPIDKMQFEDDSAAVPSRLFSHNDQQSTWMAFSPEGAQLGWGGRFADAAIASNANTEPVFTTISVAGNSVFLSGDTALPYQIGPDGVQQIAFINPDDVPLAPELTATLEDHFRGVGPQRINLFERDFVDISVRSLDANALFNDALTAGSGVTTVFPQSSLGQQLRSVADTIAIRSTLGAARQVFFVSAGGFDTHSDQANDLPALQQDVADSIAAFYAATQELGVAFDVTTFTASDFGRTLIINGDGTDHGWGGHHFAVGGAVNGRQIYGNIPVHDLGHANDAGNGRLIPSVSVEQYAAALGRWFGLSDTELNAALPLLPAFPGGPLGFL